METESFVLFKDIFLYVINYLLIGSGAYFLFTRNPEKTANFIYERSLIIKKTQHLLRGKKKMSEESQAKEDEVMDKLEDLKQLDILDNEVTDKEFTKAILRFVLIGWVIWIVFIVISFIMEHTASKEIIKENKRKAQEEEEKQLKIEAYKQLAQEKEDKGN